MTRSRAARSARRSPRARSRPSAGRATCKLQREMEAVEATPQPPAATGTRSRIQNPRTARSDRRRSADPAPRPGGRGRVRRCPIQGTASPTWCSRRRSSRPRPGPPFRWSDGAWRLDFPRPRRRPARVPDRRATAASRPDPANPLRAPGPFGDKSVIEWPEYEAPAWLESIADAGPVRAGRAALPAASSRASTCCSTRPRSRPAADAPLLVVHDGPEYADYAGLTRFLDAMSWEERIPPLRAALIAPVDRERDLLGLGALRRRARARAAAGDREAARRTAGASAWARASARSRCCTRTAATRRSFDALFLQSGSFFRQRSDKQESGFPRYQRITRFVGTVLRGIDVERHDPGRGHLRDGRGEPRQQPRARRRARRAGLPGLARRDPRRPHLDVLARRVRPAPAGADRGGRVNRRRSRSTAVHVLAYGHYGRPVVASPPRTARRATGRTAAWSTSLGGAARRGEAEALLRPVVRPRELDARATCRSRSARGATATTSGGSSRARAVRPGRLAHRTS